MANGTVYIHGTTVTFRFYSKTEIFFSAVKGQFVCEVLKYARENASLWKGLERSKAEDPSVHSFWWNSI